MSIITNKIHIFSIQNLCLNVKSIIHPFFIEYVKAIFTLVIEGKCFSLLHGNEGRVRSGKVMTYVRMHEDSKNLFVGDLR